MSKVWRRLQRVGKKAFKYHFTSFSHALKITCNKKWQPDKICLTWSRRDRNNSSKFAQWEPGLVNAYEGNVLWEKSTDLIEFDVTLYKGLNEDKYEQKEWTLMVESEDSKGKRKVLATGKLNLDEYAYGESVSKKEFSNFKLKVSSDKIKEASISFSIAVQFIKEGKATDEDMLSLASYMSTASLTTNNPYLNSNVMFDKNRTLKKCLSDFVEDPTGEQSTFNEKINFNFTEEDIDEDNINYYLNLKAKSGENNFDSISQVFKTSTDYIETAIRKDLEANNNKNHNSDFNNNNKTESKEENFDLTSKHLPIIKPSSSSNISTIKNSVSSSSVKKGKAPIVKSKENNSSSSLNKKAENGNLDETVKNNNPFLMDEPNEDTKNPFLNNKDEVSSSASSLSSNSNPNTTIKEHNLTITENAIKPIEKKIVSKEQRRAPPPPPPPQQTQKLQPLDAENLTLNDEKFDDNINNMSTILNTSKDISISNTLLDWCNSIIKQTMASSSLNKQFKQLSVENFSTSWVNGLALCVIIFHFRPNLIDITKLSESDAKANLKQAFNASDSESIMRVVDYCDIINKKHIDQLSIMTYLYQIKNHFDSGTEEPTTNQQERRNNINNDSLAMFAKISTLPTLISTPIPNKIVKNNQKISTQSKTLNRENQEQKNAPTKILPNKYPSNPFESDEEESSKATIKPQDRQKSKPKYDIIEIKPNGKIVDACLPENKHFNEPYCQEASNSNKLPMGSSKRLSRRNSLNSRSNSSSSNSSINSASNQPINNHKDKDKDRRSQENSKNVHIGHQLNSSSNHINTSEELIERAKQLIERNKPLSDESIDNSKREEIKQRAKQMIADTKKRRKSASSQRKSSVDYKNPVETNLNPTDSNNNYNNVVKAEDAQDELIGTEYVNHEIVILKKKQMELDEQGANLEEQLRTLMKKNQNSLDKKAPENDKALEDILLKKWFLLINEKNKLIYQQQELEILQNEKNLERRYEILSNQLRYLMSIDDFYKTSEQKKNETVLFHELISLVNKRNELVIQMDEENKLLNDEELINDYIQNKKSFQQKEKQCSIQ